MAVKHHPGVYPEGDEESLEIDSATSEKKLDSDSERPCLSGARTGLVERITSTRDFVSSECKIPDDLTQLGRELRKQGTIRLTVYGAGVV